MHGVLAKNQQPKQRYKVDKRYCWKIHKSVGYIWISVPPWTETSVKIYAFSTNYWYVWVQMFIWWGGEN